MIDPLSEALAERGYDTLTEVQRAVTDPALAQADLLVSAQTGSGKTVGFGLAIAPTILGDEPRLGPPATPLALVIAPTRELALQVQRELSWLYAKAGARVVPCIGGMDARDERRALDRGAHIVVGTPGRLRDHITRGSLDLSDLRAAVLDEADEMLDLGFREDLEFMLAAAPAERRTLMFSATVSAGIAKLAEQYQRDAVRVTTLARGAQHSDIAYQVVQVAAADAEHAIINLLRFHEAPTAIVFANTRAAVARLAARLANRGLPVVSLSGELSQDERSHALQALRDGRARVCVATDVAARGIDLPNLDLVIHADLPTNKEALLHRSGRTGRAGRKGISALIAPDRATAKASRLLQSAGIAAEWTFAPTPEDILALDETRLLADPVWTSDLSEAETAFAAKLIAGHSPDQIAAACLRLFRARLSAPEDLSPPKAKAPRPERAAFGASVWFELSVGQTRRAEARWLLPLLCRAANLDKTQIGKIQVQPETTLVEIAQDAVPGLLASLDAQGTLEDDIRMLRCDGPTNQMPQPPRPDATATGASQPPRKAAAPRKAETAPAPRAPHKPQAPQGDAAAAPGPDQPRRASDPARPASPERGAPGPAPAPKPARDKDRKPRHGTARKAWAKTGDTPPAADRAGKPAKPGKPAHPGKGTARAGAADTSKRMDRPGASKRPQGKPGAVRTGGTTPPRRKT